MILYTKSGCPQCKMVHALLDKKGINYEECTDIDVMLDKGLKGTPAIEVDGQILVGKTMMDYIKELH